MFVDSHAHIDGAEFDADRDEVIQRAYNAGVSKILNVGTGDPHSGAFERAADFGTKHEFTYTAVGVHPHDAIHYDDAAKNLIQRLLTTKLRMVAWGEIGLDFHYDNSPRDVQIDVFRKQLIAARELDLPVIIHTREAEEETVAALKEVFLPAARTGVFHCFTGSAELAEQALELGFMISFSGILTFKKAEELRQVAPQVPIDRLLVETDCPFLAPVPHRGKRNEPAFVIEVAKELAALHEVTVEHLADVTSQNFSTLFRV